MYQSSKGERKQRHTRVSRFGLAVRRWAGKRRGLGSNPLRLSFLFNSCGLWTLPCDFVPHNKYETLKWLSTLPTLMQKAFWWRQCSDRYIISLSPYLGHNPSPPSPFSPSLVSRTVSVDVKHHHVYLIPAPLALMEI